MTFRSSFAKPQAIAEISRDIGQVFFASLFIGTILGEPGNISVIISGLTLALIFWSISVVVARE